MDRGGRVSLAVVVAIEVPDEGTDPQAHNRLVLNRLDQPLVQIELLLPLNLCVHHCPCRCELVVDEDNATFHLFLNVDGPTDLDAINLFKQPLFSDVAGSLPTLHDHMKGRTQH